MAHRPHRCADLFRLLIPTALVAATAALGGSAIGDPTVACAEPNSGEWDVGAYDRCLLSLRNPSDAQQALDHMQYCCTNTGGNWDAVNKKCVAPPAQSAQQPGVAPKPGAATQTLEPASPPVTRAPVGEITATFEPAPAG